MHQIFNFPILFGIYFYQKHLSKRKGYKCAYGAAGTGSTCSVFGVRVFKRYSILTAIRLLNRRFEKCGRVAINMRKQKGHVEMAQVCLVGGCNVCCGDSGSGSNRGNGYSDYA